jgi:hypothetical protein
MCPKASKQPALQWYGYAVDGVGFHCLEVDEASLAPGSAASENEATVIAAENRLTCELLSQDLKALIEDNWDWKVRRISDTDFSIVCPTKASLSLCKNLCKNASGIALPVSKVSVLFADPLPHLRASAVLSKVWVALSDVPTCLRHVDLLMEGTKMLGRPRLVDEECLAASEGPVRMLFHSPTPDRLPRSVTLFANLQGFRIGVSMELAKGIDAKPPSSKDNHKGDDEDHSKDQEQTEEQSQSDCHWKRRSSKDKEKGKDVGVSGDPAFGATKVNTSSPPREMASAAVPSGPQLALHSVFKKKLMKKPGSKSSVGSSSVPPPSAKDHSATKPASAPAKVKAQPIPFNQYGSNLTSNPLLSSEPILQPQAISMTIIPDEDSAPDSPVDPDILKHSKLSSADRADIGWESPEDWEYDNETLAQKIAKLKKKQDGEVHNSPASPRNPDLVKEAVTSAPSAKARRSTAIVSPVTGTRSSARGKGADSMPILQWAVNRAAVKAGTVPLPSNSPDPAYIALAEFPDLHFMGIVDNCGLVLGNSSLSPVAVLSVLRSRETAQAKLVEAIDRVAAKEAARATKAAQEAVPEASTSVGSLGPISARVPG